MTPAKSEGPGKWAPGRGSWSHFAYQTAGAEGTWMLPEVEGQIPPDLLGRLYRIAPGNGSETQRGCGTGSGGGGFCPPSLVEEPALPVNPGGGCQGMEEEIVGHARNRGQEENDQQAFPH